MRQNCTLIGVVLLLAGVCCVSGCWLPTLWADLPAALALIMDDPNAYVADANDPLREVTPGTVMDSLAGLDGCYGAYRASSEERHGGFVGAIYEVLSFDPATNTLTRYTAQLLDGLAIVDVQTGAYAVADAGHLIFTVLRVQSNVWGDGLSDVTDDYNVLPVYRIDATLSGDRLRTAFHMPEGDLRTPEGIADTLELIHLNFACP